MRATRWPTVVAGVAIVGLLLQFGIASTQTSSARGSGVAWSHNIEEARDACENYPAETIVGVETAPTRIVKMSCDELLPSPGG